MDNNTRKMLGLTDENITFPENWLEDVKIKGVTAQLIKGSLTYNPTHCEKCVRKNQGELVKNGTKTTRTQMALFRNTLTYLELKRSGFFVVIADKPSWHKPKLLHVIIIWQKS